MTVNLFGSYSVALDVVVKNLDNVDNVYNGSESNELITAKNGSDRIAGNAGDDTIIGGGNTDLLLGGKGNDSLDGGAGADTLYGGQGDDVLIGGGGKDMLSGDLGADTLTGGGQIDTFVFTARSDDAIDTITDFAANETLLMKGYGELRATYEVVNGDDIAVSIDGHQIALLVDAAGKVTDHSFTYV